MFNGFYNPYFQSSDPVYNCQRQHARAEALLAQRARRAQYLPHEENENFYLEARRQQALDNDRRRRNAEAERYQQQLEELRRSHREHVQRKQRVPNNHTHLRSFSWGAADPVQEPVTSPQTTQTAQASSSRLATPPVEYTDVHHEAAQQIQRLYRQRRSLHSIDKVVSQFQETRNSFAVPQAIDFINSGLTDENVITVDATTPNSENTISGTGATAEICAPDLEVASSETEATLRDRTNEANATVDETPQVLEPTRPTRLPADDEFVIVKDDESANIGSQSSEPAISSADGEFVMVEDDQPSVAAQAETNVNNVDSESKLEAENTETPSAEPGAAVTDDAERPSEETVDDEDLEENTPRLAYTTRNYPLHSYMEKLNVLLTKLDSIDSYGSQNVRDRRKEAARSIEKEAGRIELVVREAWRRQSRA